MTVVRRFLHAPKERKAILIEAAVAIAFARGLTLLPIHVYTRAFGRERRKSPLALPSQQVGTARRVGSAVQRAATVVPFKAVCIEQALAASLMLRLRGVASTAYLGVHRDPTQRQVDPRGFNAHAWLRVGEKIVVGGPDVAEYVPLAMFA